MLNIFFYDVKENSLFFLTKCRLEAARACNTSIIWPNFSRKSLSISYNLNISSLLDTLLEDLANLTTKPWKTLKYMENRGFFNEKREYLLGYLSNDIEFSFPRYLRCIPTYNWRFWSLKLTSDVVFLFLKRKQTISTKKLILG